jgi:hypothetical protein
MELLSRSLIEEFRGLDRNWWSFSSFPESGLRGAATAFFSSKRTEALQEK